MDCILEKTAFFFIILGDLIAALFFIILSHFFMRALNWRTFLRDFSRNFFCVIFCVIFVVRFFI